MPFCSRDVLEREVGAVVRGGEVPDAEGSGAGTALPPGLGAAFRVQGAGFRVQGAGCRVQVAGFRVQGSGFRVQGSGFRFQHAGFRVQH